MSPIISGLLGASLFALTVGFGPLAAGSLSSNASAEFSAAAGQSGAINRVAKGDRVAASSLVSGRPALIVQVESVGQTSVAIKPQSPPRKEANYSAGLTRGEKVSRAVACEPVVSILTEVARLLEPGRCVT